MTPLNKIFRGLVFSLGVSGVDPMACISESDASAAFQVSSFFFFHIGLKLNFLPSTLMWALQITLLGQLLMGFITLGKLSFWFVSR